MSGGGGGGGHADDDGDQPTDGMSGAADVSDFVSNARCGANAQCGTLDPNTPIAVCVWPAGRVHGLIHGWMDGRMDVRWMDGWMNGWMD